MHLARLSHLRCQLAVAGLRGREVGAEGRRLREGLLRLRRPGVSLRLHSEQTELQSAQPCMRDKQWALAWIKAIST